MRHQSRKSRLPTVAAVVAGAVLGARIGFSGFTAKAERPDLQRRDPVTVAPPNTVPAAATPLVEIASASKPAADDRPQQPRHFVWSTASASRAGITTIHWHPCTWAIRISQSNRASLEGTWEQVTGTIGGRYRRCNVCEGLD